MSCWRCYSGPDLSPLAQLWEAAFRRCPLTVFQTFTFAHRWAEIFARECDMQVWSDGELLIPLASREGELWPLGEGLFDYVDLVGTTGDLHRAAEWIAGQAWSSLQITGVRASSPFAPFWRELAGEGEAFTAAPHRLPDTADPAGGLEAEHRRAASRWRRAQAQGAVCERLDEPTARARLLTWMLERKSERLAAHGTANVLGSREQRWLERMITAEPQLSELWRLRLRQRPIAGLLCWLHAGTRYAYTICHDPEFNLISPGILLLFAVLRFTMEERLRFDFLTGEQAFKQRFATHREPLWRFRRHRQ